MNENTYNIPSSFRSMEILSQMNKKNKNKKRKKKSSKSFSNNDLTQIPNYKLKRISFDSSSLSDENIPTIPFNLESKIESEDLFLNSNNFDLSSCDEILNSSNSLNLIHEPSFIKDFQKSSPVRKIILNVNDNIFFNDTEKLNYFTIVRKKKLFMNPIFYVLDNDKIKYSIKNSKDDLGIIFQIFLEDNLMGFLRIHENFQRFTLVSNQKKLYDDR